MSKSNFREDFKRDAVRQITERSYPVAEVSQRLGSTSIPYMNGRSSRRRTSRVTPRLRRSGG